MRLDVTFPQKCRCFFAIIYQILNKTAEYSMVRLLLNCFDILKVINKNNQYE